MNKLSTEKRVQILGMLVEGVSMRAISRLTKASINTVTKLLTDAADAAEEYHAEHVRGIQGSRHIQCDELWSFVYAKEAHVPSAKAAPPEAGDAWTFTALDTESKLIVSYLVGPRDGESALAFMDDLRTRIEERPQVSTDGLKAYREATWEAFGGDVDFCSDHQAIRQGRRSGPAEVQPREVHRHGEAGHMGISESGHGQHVTRGAAQPLDAHGDAPLYPPDQRLLKEAGEALRGAVAVLLPLQPREAARRAAH